MQHAFGTGLEHERNSRFDQLSQRMCPWSFFWASNLKFFFLAREFQISLSPPAQPKKFLGPPQKCPTEWEWWQLLQIHCQGGGMIIYKDEWTQRLVMKLRITHIIGDVSFSFFWLLFSQGPVLWQKMAETLWDCVRYDVDVKLQQSQDSHKFRLHVCGVCKASPINPKCFGSCNVLTLMGPLAFCFHQLSIWPPWTERSLCTLTWPIWRLRALDLDEKTWRFGRNVTLRYRHYILFFLTALRFRSFRSM